MQFLYFCRVRAHAVPHEAKLVQSKQSAKARYLVDILLFPAFDAKRDFFNPKP